MKTKEIVILGSTGSIGEQALDVARMHGYKIKALAVHGNVDKLVKQVDEFSPEIVALYDESKYAELKEKLGGKAKIVCGLDGLCQLAALKCDIVLNAVSGAVGLKPTLAAIDACNMVALANKETLVAGGEIVTERAREKDVHIIPVDSEHSAIFQCIEENNKDRINKIILTASGGPFFRYSKEQLKKVTRAEALKHPNWEMGAKITIDSATLMNKGLEFIEAMHLFNVSPRMIEIIVHPESIVHSAVEYIDGSIIAHMGVPDMRIPIQYAFTYPKRISSPAKKLSLTDVGKLTFEKPDFESFRSLSAAVEAAKLGGNAPAAINAANEELVRLFLDGKIEFYKISEYNEKTLNALDFVKKINLDIINETDLWARGYVIKLTNN